MKLTVAMRFVALAFIASQAACLSLPNEALGTPLHEGCELTMQSNSLAGKCGEMILKNTGSYAMHGWSIVFKLPNNARLTNTWNGAFDAQPGLITVTPFDGDLILEPSDTVSVGYCATGQATNMTLTAGRCELGDDAETTE